MKLFSKALLMTSKKKEQHIIQVAIVTNRLTGLTYNDDFSVISVSTISGVSDMGYVQFYLDDMENYEIYCNDDSGKNLGISVSSIRYAINISPKNYTAGLYIFNGGVRNKETGETVQTFVINYIKVD